MTMERTTIVAIPKEVWENEFAAFARQAERAVARYEKAPPGDRREAVRYEALCRSLERMVILSVRKSSDWMQWDLDDESGRALDVSEHKFRHPWSLSGREVCAAVKGQVFTGLEDVDGYATLFELRQPFDAGLTVVTTQRSDGNADLQSPSDVWKAPKSAKGVFAAIAARWHDQLKAATANEGKPLVPSGVNNQVLSEGLRDFVASEHGQQPVHARVVYRDGSEARPFPLRAPPDEGPY